MNGVVDALLAIVLRIVVHGADGLGGGDHLQLG